MATHSKAPRNLNRNWTKQQEADLLDMYGVYSFSHLSRRFGKTPYAIKCKYASLTGNWSALEAGGYVLTVDVADALGICDKTVRRWIEAYDLPATQLYKKRNDSKRRQYYISVEEFWKWAYEHKNLIVFSRVKRDVLLPEPTWLDVEIKNNKEIPPKTRQTWSKEEADQAYTWFMSGVHYKEIAEKLGRTSHGVHRKLMRMIHQKRNGVLGL